MDDERRARYRQDAQEMWVGARCVEHDDTYDASPADRQGKWLPINRLRHYPYHFTIHELLDPAHTGYLNFDQLIARGN